MAKMISLFNHKGGVSKTTTAFNLGWIMARQGVKVLLIDADPQCNLTSLALSLPDESAFEELYNRKNSNDIFSLVRPMMTEAKKDISRNEPISNIVETKQERLYILPGHLEIEEFSTQITLALELGVSKSFSMMTGVPGYLNYALRELADIHKIDYILIDMAPSLSGLNEVLLMSSDYFIAPCSPDFFSEIALKNLSRVIPEWYDKIKDFNERGPNLAIPCATKFLGIVQQKYRPRKRAGRDDPNQPTVAFEKWIERVREATNGLLVPALRKKGLAIEEEQFTAVVQDQQPYNLSLVSDFNSLVAVSQMQNKPVFELTREDLRSKAAVFGLALETMEENVRRFNDVFEDLAGKIVALTTP